MTSGTGNVLHKNNSPQINNPTKLFGVFGDPVAHSLSPAMHNRAFADAGYKGVYLPFQVEEIEPAVIAVRTLGISGISVTLPHKVAVMEYLDRLDPLAKRIGAVNTIVNADGVLTGYNISTYETELLETEELISEHEKNIGEYEEKMKQTG